MAEDVFKNVQVLKGIPVKEFMNTMGFFSAATNLNCIDCHSPQSESLEGYAIDTPRKVTTRRMIAMVNAINQGNFGGRGLVTCYTCHRASDRPEAVPSLLDQYSIPEDDPDRVEVIPPGPTQAANKRVTADQVLDKYLEALGGAAAVGRLTSFAAKGTYEGYDTLSMKVPVDIFASAPNQLSMVVHTQNGNSVTTYDGSRGWIAAADKLMRVLPLTGGDLEGARMDALLSFPARIKQDLQWRTGFPSVSIDDKPVKIVRTRRAALRREAVFRQSIWAARSTGALCRHRGRRHSDAHRLLGLRPIAGVKIPFHRVLTWTDGRSTIDLSEVQPNVRMAAGQFAMPAPPRARAATP